MLLQLSCVCVGGGGEAAVLKAGVNSYICFVLLGFWEGDMIHACTYFSVTTVSVQSL